MDNEIYVEMLLKDPHSIQVVPEEHQNTVLIAVFANSGARVSEIVRLWPAAWPCVPEHLRHKTLLECISEYPTKVNELLETVPDEYLDYEICLKSINLATYDLLQILAHIPEVYRTRELCRAFIEADDSSLAELPQELQFDNMCVEMVLAGRAWIHELPEHLLSQEICDCAQFRSLGDIPEDYRSDTLCMKAVREDGENLRYVPSHMISVEISLQAVTTTGTALQFIPAGARNPAVVAAALHSDPVAAAWVPDFLRAMAEFSEAARELVGQIRRIPDEQLDDTFVMAIIAAEGRLLMEVPPHFHTPAICELAFGNLQLLLSKFPVNMRTREVCLASVRRSWRSLRSVPMEYLFNDDVCEAAIRKGPYAFNYVPIDHPRREELRALAIQIACDRGDDPRIIDMELRKLSLIQADIPG